MSFAGRALVCRTNILLQKVDSASTMYILYIHTYGRMGIYVYVSVYKYIYIYIHIHTHISIYSYIYLYTYIYIYTYLYNAYIYMHIYLYIHIHKNMYIVYSDPYPKLVNTPWLFMACVGSLPLPSE